MNVKVDELMARRVVTAQPHHTVGHVRNLMTRNRVSALPVVGPEGEALGIVSRADLLGHAKEATPVNQVMTEKVYTIPRYEDVSVAARLMRNRQIHRVVVTHEQKIVGILSAFDLLKLVEGHRFVRKNAPTTGRRKASGRA